MNASLKASVVRAIPCPEALAPVTKKAKMIHDGTDGAEFEMPQRLPSSMNGLRQMPATKIIAIMERLGLPLNGTKAHNVTALSKHLRAQQQNALVPTAFTNSDTERGKGEEAIKPLLCTSHKFENRGNESPIHADDVVTVDNVKDSVHFGYPFYGWPGSVDVHRELALVSK